MNDVKSGSRRSLMVAALVLTVVLFAVYLQTMKQPFVFDDEDYITNNPHVATGLTGENIAWAFTSSHSSNWHPVTWISHMVDVQLYGMSAGGHHLTNVIIHAAATLLLLLLLFRITGRVWQSTFVAALFALHPLHVESVAWVAERKDVLSAFFGFLTLLLYSEYARERKSSLYLCTLVSFVLGLMSKPMLVTLPVLMLLLDYWPLDRLRTGALPKLLQEKIPFFACSVLSAIVTIYAQQAGGSIGSFKALPVGLRVENALVSYVEYIVKALWPADLALFYPLPSAFPLWQVSGALLVLVLVTVAAIRYGKKYRYLPMGWLWYLVTLLPVIGLIQVGDQALADRYSYIPLIGLFVIVAWGLPDLTGRLRQRNVILSLLAGAAVAACALLSWHQLGFWRDNITLYRHSLQAAPGSSIIHNNLGIALAGKGDLDGAIQEYRQAILYNPNDENYYNNLGAALDEKGDAEAAIAEYRKALQISPNLPDVLNNLGLALTRTGRIEEGIQTYQRALQINPDYAAAHFNLGLAYSGRGNLEAAIREYQKTLLISPDFAPAQNKLAAALAQRSGGGK